MILEKREKSSLVSESNDEIYNKLLDEMVECKKVEWEKSSIIKKVHNVSVNFSIIIIESFYLFTLYFIRINDILEIINDLSK